MTSTNSSVDLGRERLAEAIRSSDSRSQASQRELLAALLADIYEARQTC